MVPEQEDLRIVEARAKLERGFQGEEEQEGVSTPQKDLVASGVIAAVAVAAMVLAWQMPDPGRSFFSHPGLLPFATGLALLAMAAGLAARALRDGGARGMGGIFDMPRDPAERDYVWRSWLLMALVTVFIVAVDLVSFRVRIPIADFEFKLSSFECVSIPFVAIIMKVYWRGSWWRCLLTAVVASMLLAAAFRWGFKIPMPGVD